MNQGGRGAMRGVGEKKRGGGGSGGGGWDGGVSGA